MKKETLQKLIYSKLTLKDGKTIAKIHSDVIDLIVFNQTYKPYHYSGSGRNISKAGVDKASAGLRIIGVDFETGNDSPCGGHSGYFVRLTKNGIKQTKDYRDSQLALYKENDRLQQIKNKEITLEKSNKKAELMSLIKSDFRFYDFIHRKRYEGNNDRKIAWKLTSETRVPNLYGYSIKEIIDTIGLIL